MKDKELRKEVDVRLNNIGFRYNDLVVRVERLEDPDTSIRPCPKCKHDTIHQFHPQTVWRRTTMLIYTLGQLENFHRCLNCGKDWVYSEETVAREYKPVKCGRDRKK